MTKTKWIVAALVLLLAVALTLSSLLSKKNIENVFDEMHAAYKKDYSLVGVLLPKTSNLHRVDIWDNNVKYVSDDRYIKYKTPAVRLEPNEQVFIDFSEHSISFTYYASYDAEESGGMLELSCRYDVESKTLTNESVFHSESYEEKMDSNTTRRPASKWDNHEFTNITLNDFLVKYGIESFTEEECFNYFMHEKVLSDYFEYNEKRSNFSIDDPGFFGIDDQNRDLEYAF